MLKFVTSSTDDQSFTSRRVKALFTLALLLVFVIVHAFGNSAHLDLSALRVILAQVVHCLVQMIVLSNLDLTIEVLLAGSVVPPSVRIVIILDELRVLCRIHKVCRMVLLLRENRGDPHSNVGIEIGVIN